MNRNIKACILFLGSAAVVGLLLLYTQGCAPSRALVTGAVVDGTPQSGWVECVEEERCMIAAAGFCKLHPVQIVSHEVQEIRRPRYDPVSKRWVWDISVVIVVGFQCKDLTS